MKRLFLVAVLLSGCASVSEFYGPDGERYINIECDGSGVPMSTCYRAASSACPQGYYLVDQRRSVGAINAAISPQFGALAQGYHKSIVVRCK